MLLGIGITSKLEVNLCNIMSFKLGIIGIGYVGLPLAVEFGRKRSVIGFDINQKRIEELQSGCDCNQGSDC